MLILIVEFFSSATVYELNHCLWLYFGGIYSFALCEENEGSEVPISVTFLIFMIMFRQKQLLSQIFFFKAVELG